MTGPARVVVVGGGLAGMAAAVALESAGARVTLLESRRFLGGRAGSFEDPQTGELLDNCQHVLLGCCTNLIDFYKRIGALHLIRFDRTIHFRDERGRRHDLSGVRGLPAPLHLSSSLARFSALTVSERASLIRAMVAMMATDARQRDVLADVPFGDWLDRHRQPESLVRKFYDVLVISGLNERTRDVSAAYALQLFQESLLANAQGYVVGVPNCPLSQLYASVPLRDLRLGARAGEVQIFKGRVTGVTFGDEAVPADAVVVATNHHALDRLVPHEWSARDNRFASLDQLQSVPILGAHLWFDRPVLREPHAALIGGPLQWVFARDQRGSALHGVISAAREWIDRPRDEMLSMFEEQVRNTFSEAREAKLLRGNIVVEKRATFSPLPGVERFRPAQAPPRDGIQGLYLAGDYTHTGWPATMEGAVRSGYLAAEALLAEFAPELPVHKRTFLAEDLPIQWPARLLGYSR